MDSRNHLKVQTIATLYWCPLQAIADLLSCLAESALGGAAGESAEFDLGAVADLERLQSGNVLRHSNLAAAREGADGLRATELAQRDGHVWNRISSDAAARAGTLLNNLVLVTVYDTVPNAVAQAVQALLRQCFHSAAMTDEQRQDQADRFCSQGDVLKHIIAVDDEAVIGFAKSYRRTIVHHGRAVVLGGLGDVCTDPDRRHAGVATAVVQTAMDELHAAGCDLAYLCAEVNNPGIVRLYGQVGFVPLNHPQTFLGMSGKRYTDLDAMIAPVQSPSVFQAVLHDREPFDIGRGNW